MSTAKLERIVRRLSGRGMSRREFMHGALGAGLISPLLPRLEAFGQGAAEPKRIFFFMAPNGLPLPRRGGAGAANDFWPSGSDFELRRILEPLAPHKQDLLLVKGLDLKSFIALPHTTAEAVYCNQRSGGTSIDELISRAFSRPGQRGVLRLSMHAGSRSRAHLVNGQRAELETSPHNLARTLFGGLDVAGQGDAASEALQAAGTRRRRVLERVRGDLEELKAELGAADRALVEKHQREVAVLLETLSWKPTGKGCEAPVLPSFNPASYDDSPRTFKAYLDIVRAAFACDVSRVAAMQYGQYVAGTRFPFLRMPDGKPLPPLSRGADDSGARDTHHAYSHLIEEGMGPLVQVYRYFFENLARFVTDLKNTPVASGGSLFDHTLIVTTNELGAGIPHIPRNIPFLLIGGGWHFKTGRYHQKNAESHGKLLVEICRAMGLKIDRVGDPNSQGGMPELT